MLTRLRHGLLLAMLMVLLFGVTEALIAGSRMARYVAVAWIGVFSVSTGALITEIVLDRLMPFWMVAITTTMTVEILVLTLGVFDRIYGPRTGTEKLSASLTPAD